MGPALAAFPPTRDCCRSLRRINPRPHLSNDEAMTTPWPVPIGDDVLLYGGTFDPPHRAHAEVAAAARDAAVPAAWLVYVPAARNPLKRSGPIATGAQRVEMLDLATTDIQRVGVWTDEIDRVEALGEPAYWIDTLRRARSLIGRKVALRFLIGADQAVSFHRWREARSILELAEPLVMPRDAVLEEQDLAEGLRATDAWEPGEIEAWCRRLVRIAPMAASSTDARRGVLEHVSPSVRNYALRAGLYQDGASDGVAR